MNCEYIELLNKIKEYDKITLFRHTHPDGDAAGSQLGTKEWLKYNFPNKEVKALGKEYFFIYPYVDEASDEFIKESLAIVFDTSNATRVDDERFKLAKEIFRIDHHPYVETFENYVIDEENRASASELIADILMSKGYEAYTMPKRASELFYSGMLTDTLNFKTTNCTSRTLYVAAKLVDTGIEMTDISMRMFDQSETDFATRSKLRNHYKYKDGLCFIKLNKKTLEKLGISSNKAKTMIDEFGSVKSFKIWAILAYNNETGLYDGSLRSKKGYTVNEIASHFNGGGHINAAGIKGLSEKDVKQLKKELQQEIESKG